MRSKTLTENWIELLGEPSKETLNRLKKIPSKSNKVKCITCKGYGFTDRTSTCIYCKGRGYNEQTKKAHKS